MNMDDFEYPRETIKTVELFIKEHHHIHYCEAIIYPNGLIQNAYPSHTEALIQIYGKPRTTVWDEIPITDSPIAWLLERTGCIAVWYNALLVYDETKITKEQQRTLDELEAHKITNIRGE